MTIRISIDKEQIADFCRRNQIQRLAVFGSALRDDFGPESDVDTLVEFKPGVSVGLIRMAQLEIELSGLIGRKVDLRTEKDLSRYFRATVLSQAEELYAS